MDVADSKHMNVNYISVTPVNVTTYTVVYLFDDAPQPSFKGIAWSLISVTFQKMITRKSQQ